MSGMSGHMRQQLRISGKGNYVASRSPARPPMLSGRGGRIPPSAPRKVNRRTSAVRRQGKR